MKHSAWLVFLLSLMLTLALSACMGAAQPSAPGSTEGEQEEAPHVHTFGEWVTLTEATCTEDGAQERICACGEKETQVVEALSHDEVIDEAVPATCKADGLTSGKHCGRCGEVFVAQLTIGKSWHKEVIDEGIPVSCFADGLTEGKHCSECGDILVAQTVIKATGHKVVKDKAIPVSCTSHGKTEGSHCDRCGEVFVEQQLIKAPGHVFGDWTITKTPTHAEKGERAHTCQTCNKTLRSTLDIVKLEGKYGSAGKITDKTVIVSVFANDLNTRWDLDSSEDRNIMAVMRDRLSVAVDWLEQQCRAYGAEADFVYDWQEDPELFYTLDFSYMDMVDTNAYAYADAYMYFEERAYALQYIDAEALKEKYDAPNILYLFYYNAAGRSWAMPDMSHVDAEIVNLYVYEKVGTEIFMESSVTHAHEILHCFGAPDLYYASDFIPQAYVDYCQRSGSRDVMFTSTVGHNISMQFTDVCAYYVGLIDTCPEVERWGLGKSTHLPK